MKPDAAAVVDAVNARGVLAFFYALLYFKGSREVEYVFQGIWIKSRRPFLSELQAGAQRKCHRQLSSVRYSSNTYSTRVAYTFIPLSLSHVTSSSAHSLCLVQGNGRLSNRFFDFSKLSCFGRWLFFPRTPFVFQVTPKSRSLISWETGPV